LLLISKEQIKLLYETMTVKAAAAELGVSRPTFYKYLKRAEVELSKDQKKIKLVN
jgi:transposase